MTCSGRPLDPGSLGLPWEHLAGPSTASRRQSPSRRRIHTIAPQVHDRRSRGTLL